MKQIQKDKNGKILSMTEYNKDGEMIYFVDYVSGYWCRMKRDERGNIIHYCDSDKHWQMYQYDKNDNLIYELLSDGKCIEYEYDEEGREIFVKDSTGFWKKTEYDIHGNEIYIEKSDGFTCCYYGVGQIK